MTPTEPTTPDQHKPRSAQRPPALPRAEHIGSLLRPPALLREIDDLQGRRPGFSATLLKPRDVERLREAENREIRRVVERQIACGLDVVTDGEFRRTLFADSFYDAIDGLRPGNGQGTGAWSREGSETVTFEGPPLVERRISKVDSPGARDAAFLADLTDLPTKVTFPAASFFVTPMPARGIQPAPPGYEDRSAFEDHMIAVLRDLVRDAIDAGATYIQFDFPSYVYLMDGRFSAEAESHGVSLPKFLERCLWADRSILADLPRDVRYGLHLCRGNHASSWRFAGSLEPVAERMFNELPYDSFLIEWEDVQREGDYSPLRHCPPGPVVVLGLVSSKRPELESDDDVVRGIEEAARYIDADQLALSPQCGFASTLEGNRLNEDAQWCKLELVGRVAARVWGSR